MKNISIKWFAFLLPLIFTSCLDEYKPLEGPWLFPEEEPANGFSYTPEVLNADEEATITFKASGGSGLYDYSGDVYLHIGAADGTDWLYVPAGWDENLDKCKMTKVADNQWSITLSSSIRQWLGAADGVPVQRLGLVVRSADGSAKGVESDFFVMVTDDTFSPSASVSATMPAGATEGINMNGTSVTLAFYDKDTDGNSYEYAYVIGDFNDWKVDNAYQMKRDEAAGCWWITLDGLHASTEYGFQYYVGSKATGALRVADAYTEKVITTDDQYISASTYPGLRDYPTDKTAGIISTFQITPTTYNWEVTDFAIADKNKLIIYEMLLRDFTSTADITGAMDKLDYLRSLGVNAIELMPVQEFDGNDSWGYAPCFYFAMDKAYGTKEMYKQFIDACHKRGMAVILDVVYNQATGNHPFAKLYWNASAGATASNNPWFNVEAPHPYSVFQDWNHESPLVRAFVKRNLEFLLSEYKIDGFRFDLTKGFTQNSSTESTASNYDASRVAILKDYNATIVAANPKACVILEHFAEEAEEAELANDGMQLWRNLNNAYCQTAMGYSEGSAFTALTTDGTSMPFGGWVGYMESHDEERAAYKQTAYATGALKTDLATRMKQLQTNAALFFTVPGPKMIWQFGELGYDISIEQNGRTGKKPVLWDYYDNTDRKGLYDVYSKLIALRTSTPQLFNAETTMVWHVAESDWAAGRTISLYNGIEGLVAVGNFTNTTITSSVEFPSTGTWKDYVSGGTLNVTTTSATVSVPANSFFVYTNFQ